MPVRSADAEVRIVIDRRDKLGLEGPGAAAREVIVMMKIESPAPPERVAALVRHAERGCHAEQSLAQAVPLTTATLLNGTPLDT